MLMMLPFEAPTIFEGIHKSYFRMPRVVKDQRSRFENDDLFRQLSHESAVKYTGFKDRPLEERQMKFIANCQEGHTEVSVVQTGNQFTLMFNPPGNPAYTNQDCDFNKELGKVHIRAKFILNGVCVLWRGWIDLQRLEGFGCLEYDEYQAYLEDAMAKQQVDIKQPMCNNNINAPLGPRLNHHLGVPPASINHAAGAVTTNSMLPSTPIGLNSHPSNNLAGGPPPPPQPQPLATGLAPPPPSSQPPPVSLADTAAAHYGNAAIAAAAAAAFHQALSVGPGCPQSLHGLSGPPPSALAAAAAAASAASNGLHGLPPPPHSLVSQHLAYTNGIIPTQHNGTGTSPHHHQTSPHHYLNSQATNGTPPQHLNSNNNQTRSPERENHHHHNHHQQNNHEGKRARPTKRPQEDLSQTDEVDVVSDISAHDLDFPPRRIFKSEPITSHHNHHKISRRAA